MPAVIWSSWKSCFSTYVGWRCPILSLTIKNNFAIKCVESLPEVNRNRRQRRFVLPRVHMLSLYCQVFHLNEVVRLVMKDFFSQRNWASGPPLRVHRAYTNTTWRICTFQVRITPSQCIISVLENIKPISVLLNGFLLFAKMCMQTASPGFVAMNQQIFSIVKVTKTLLPRIAVLMGFGICCDGNHY